MNQFYTFIGEGEQLNVLQMCVRTFILFFVALLLMRIGGMRIFGKRSALDNIIVIMLGAVLARAIVGASPLVPTIAAGAVMILLHKVLSYIAVKNERVFNIVNGNPLVLYKDNQILWHNMRKGSISQHELMESLHLETKKIVLDDIDIAFLETNGRISFILKEKG